MPVKPNVNAMLKTEYLIQIVKQGDGASQATADFKRLEVAANSAKTSVVASSQAIAASTATIGTQTALAADKTRVAQQAITSSLRIIAFTAFPQVANAAMVTQASFQGLRAAAAVFGTSLATISAVVVALGSAVAITVEKIRELRALIGLSNTNIDAGMANQRLHDSLLMNISVMEQGGKITSEQAEGMRGLVAGTAALRDNIKEEHEALLGLAGSLVFINEQEWKRLKFAEQRSRLGRELIGATLPEDERKQFEASGNFTDRLNEIAELRRQEGITAEERDKFSALAQKGYEKEIALIRNQAAAHKELALLASENFKLISQGTQQFAAGLSEALVASFTEGSDALKRFAAQFMQQIAEMILKALILRAIWSAITGLGGSSGVATGVTGVTSGLGFAGETAPTGFADGGIVPRMMAAGGIAGLSMVSQPTYFRDFNAVVGERGPEIMTVLSRPKMMQVGGIEAAVGRAGGFGELAITRASDLQHGQAGRSEVVIRLEPGLRGEIVQEAVGGARVVIVRDMRDDSELSQATRKLVS